MSTEGLTATVDSGASGATATTSSATAGNTMASGQGTTATVEPFYKDFLQSDGTLNHKSLERLPEHLKPLKATWERAKTIEDLGTMYLNSQMLNGKKALAPLPPDAPAHVVTERKQLMDTLNGVPTTPKDYGITRPQDFPENGWSQPAADNLAAWAHKHSVSPQAAKELMQEHGKIVQAQLAEQAQYETKFWQEQQTAFDAAIRQENIPSERANALVEKGATALGLDLTNERTKTFLKGSDARLMAMRHAIAIGEDKAVTATTGTTAVPDPAAAAADIRTNPANPLNAAYWNKDGKYSRAAHDAAVERHNEFMKLAAAKQEQGAKR